MLINETKKEKARRLRYRKPVVSGLSVDDIREDLWEMQERCQEAIWLCDEDEETIVNALCGDDDDACQFRMQVSDVNSEIEQMLEDMHDAYIPDCFDDFFVSMCGRDAELLGYDTYEQDYYSLESWENSYSVAESKKRLEALTKKELLEATAYCLKFYVSYLSLKTRYESLTAALDILRDKNTGVLRNAKALDTAYENYARNGCRIWSSEAKELDRIAGMMPAEAWLR